MRNGVCRGLESKRERHATQDLQQRYSPRKYAIVGARGTTRRGLEGNHDLRRGTATVEPCKGEQGEMAQARDSVQNIQMHVRRCRRREMTRYFRVGGRW